MKVSIWWVLVGAVAAVIVPMLIVLGPELTVFAIVCSIMECKMT